MPLLHRFAVLPAVLALSACFQAEQPSQRSIFVGTWTCETATLVLTEDTYDEGNGPLRLAQINQDNGNFTLFLKDGRRIGLALVTGTALTWVRGGSAPQQTCLRRK